VQVEVGGNEKERHERYKVRGCGWEKQETGEVEWRGGAGRGGG